MEGDDQEHTDVSQLYQLNTLNSRILDETADGIAQVPWMTMSAQASNKNKNNRTESQSSVQNKTMNS